LWLLVTIANLSSLLPLPLLGLLPTGDPQADSLPHKSTLTSHAVTHQPVLNEVISNK
jgi:hypothetical protein